MTHASSGRDTLETDTALQMLVRLVAAVDSLECADQGAFVDEEGFRSGGHARALVQFMPFIMNLLAYVETFTNEQLRALFTVLANLSSTSSVDPSSGFHDADSPLLDAEPAAPVPVGVATGGANFGVSAGCLWA